MLALSDHYDAQPDLYIHTCVSDDAAALDSPSTKERRRCENSADTEKMSLCSTHEKGRGVPREEEEEEADLCPSGPFLAGGGRFVACRVACFIAASESSFFASSSFLFLPPRENERKGPAGHLSLTARSFYPIVMPSCLSLFLLPKAPFPPWAGV